jgi:hypothetical protein
VNHIYVSRSNYRQPLAAAVVMAVKMTVNFIVAVFFICR